MEGWCILYDLVPQIFQVSLVVYAYVLYISLPIQYEKQHMQRIEERIRWRDGVYFLI